MEEEVSGFLARVSAARAHEIAHAMTSRGSAIAKGVGAAVVGAHKEDAFVAAIGCVEAAKLHEGGGGCTGDVHGSVGVACDVEAM